MDETIFNPSSGEHVKQEEPHVRITARELKKLVAAARTLIDLQRENAELKLRLDNLSLMQHSQLQPQLTIDSDPDAAMDEISQARSAVSEALKQGGFFPTPAQAEETAAIVQTGNPGGTGTAAPSKSHRRQLRYAPIWDAAIEAIKLGIRHDPKSVPSYKLNNYPIPTELNPSNVEVLCQAIEQGMSRRGAFALAGITSTLLHVYGHKAKLNIEPYRTLFDLIEIAEARIENKLVSRWEQHTRDSWQASQALLAKRFVNEWGDRRVLDITMQEMSTLTPEQLAEFVGPEAIQWIREQALQATTADPPMLTEEDVDYNPPTTN